MHARPAKRPLVIIGSGGHATSLAGVALEAGFTVQSLIAHGGPKVRVLDLPVISSLEELSDRPEHYDFALAVGDNACREQAYYEFAEQIPSANWPVVPHPSATVSRLSSVGGGTVLMPGAVIGPNATIGRFCILNTASSVDHDCSIADFASTAPGARLGGGVIVGTRTAICIGAVVKHATRLGSDSVLGANSYLNADLPSKVVAFGTPAQVKRARRKGDPYL